MLLWRVSDQKKLFHVAKYLKGTPPFKKEDSNLVANINTSDYGDQGLSQYPGEGSMAWPGSDNSSTTC